MAMTPQELAQHLSHVQAMVQLGNDLHRKPDQIIRHALSYITTHQLPFTISVTNGVVTVTE